MRSSRPVGAGASQGRDPGIAWALGRLVAQFVSGPLERLLLRAVASRARGRAGLPAQEVSA